MNISSKLAADLKHLDKIPFGERSTYMKKLSQKYGKSKASLYRKKNQLSPSYKKSPRKNIIDSELINRIEGMKIDGLKKNGSTPSTKTCINELKKIGVKGAESLTVSTVDRRLREVGFNPNHKRRKSDSKKGTKLVHEIRLHGKAIEEKLKALKQEKLFLALGFSTFEDFLEKELYIQKINNSYRYTTKPHPFEPEPVG